MGLNICPYYYKNGTSNKEVFYFECCHRPKDVEDCPEGRRDNECKVLTLTFDATFNVELINEIMKGRKF